MNLVRHIKDDYTFEDGWDYNVIVYQANIDVPYVFRSFSTAEPYFDIDDYNFVTTFQCNNHGDVNSVEDLLNHLWDAGNNGTLQKAIGKQFRSVSMSDVFDINGELYYVDTFGFKKIS